MTTQRFTHAHGECSGCRAEANYYSDLEQDRAAALAASQADVTRLAAELAESVRALAVSQGEAVALMGARDRACEIAATTHGHNVKLHAERERLRGDLERARGLLARLEWVDMRPLSGIRRCPSCMSSLKLGHAVGCELAAFLAPPTPTASPEPDRASPEVTVKEPRP
jgi:hypothetical protein